MTDGGFPNPFDLSDTSAAAAESSSQSPELTPEAQDLVFDSDSASIA